MAYTPTDNPYIPGDPYSYDLKWIVQKVHELLDDMEALNTSQGNLQQSFEDLRQYVADYFARLDIEAEVSAQIQQLYQDGYFDDIIADWITRNKVLLLDQDQSGTFTEDEKAQGRKNLRAGATNPNLLDNPWFTVNQRSFSTYTLAAGKYYMVDRWYTNVTATTIVGTWVLNDGKMAVTTTGSGRTELSQRIPKLNSMLAGKKITASVMLGDGTIKSFTGTIPARTTASQNVISATVQSGVTLDFILNPTTSNFDLFRIYVNAGTSAEFAAVKLELGTVATLANDAPPDDELELLECKKYCRVIDAGSIGADMLLGRFNANGNVAFFSNIIGFGNTMRTTFTTANTTFTLEGSWIVYDLTSSTGTNYAVTSITNNNGTKYPNMSVAFEGTATPYAPCLLRSGGSGAKIIISQDL